MILLCSSYGASVRADEVDLCDKLAVTDLTQLELEQLHDLPVFVSATQQAMCERQAAGIVTIFTGEELRNMGARDLTDVLQLVPGFVLGANMYNTLAMGVRGIEADGGRVSVLIDGVSVTERRFGGTPLGGRFYLDHIDRIEIVRGPGSILHGNFTELGLINIITKKGKQLDGGHVSGQYGHYQRGEARKTIGFAGGKQWGDWEVSFSGHRGLAARSDRIYRDARGNSFDMVGHNEMDSLQGNLHLRYKNLGLRLLVDEYLVTARDGFSDCMAPAGQYIGNEFNTYAAQLSYSHSFTHWFKFDGSAEFARQNPWERTRHYLDGRPSLLREQMLVDHYSVDGKFTLASQAGHYLTVGNSFAVNLFDAKLTGYDGALPAFSNYTAYAEGFYKTAWVDVLAGLRFDAYNEFGTNLAPRVALLKTFGDFHFKALYSHAFQAPTGSFYHINADYNTNRQGALPLADLEPERVYTSELELGYQLSRHWAATINLFYTQMDNMLLYQVDERLDDFYSNTKGLDTRGFEAMLRFKDDDWGYLNLGYAYYQAARNPIDTDQIRDAQGQWIHPNIKVGFPTHKVTLNQNIPLTESLSFNHSLIFFSDRYTYRGKQLEYHEPVWVYNLFFRYQNFLAPGLEAGFGVYDVFNERYQYTQTWNGGHPPLPGPSREFLFKLSYQFQ